MGRRKIPELRPEGCVSTEEAADLLGITRTALFNHRKTDPNFPQPVQSGRGGRYTWYRKVDILAWRERREKDAPQK